MKTAVEYIKEQLLGDEYWYENQTFEQIFDKAKEMEKQNIIESYCQGCFDMWKDDGIVPRETAEDYYNETFKTN
jgi:hypothetical protein